MMLMWIVPLLLLALLWERPARRGGSASWLLIVAALLVLPGLGMWSGWMHGGWMHGGWMHGSTIPRWGSVVGALLFLAALGAFGYLALRSGKRETEELQILRLRLARGEISPEDYDLLRQKLSS